MVRCEYLQYFCTNLRTSAQAAGREVASSLLGESRSRSASASTRVITLSLSLSSCSVHLSAPASQCISDVPHVCCFYFSHHLSVLT